MKKAFSMLLIVIAVSISLNIATENRAEARWQYVGNPYGVNCYLDTGSISIRSRSPWSFTCTMRRGNSTFYLNFFQSNRTPCYKVSGDNNTYRVSNDSCASRSIYNYVVNYY